MEILGAMALIYICALVWMYKECKEKQEILDRKEEMRERLRQKQKMKRPPFMC